MRLTTYLCATATVVAVAIAGARSAAGARAAVMCRPVCVSGWLRGPALLPGGPGDRLLIALRAPGPERVAVTSLVVSFNGRLPAGCPASGFAVDGVPLTGEVPTTTLALRRPVVLGGRRAAGTARYATTLALFDTGQNQDACQGLRLALRFAARAS